MGTNRFGKKELIEEYFLMRNSFSWTRYITIKPMCEECLKSYRILKIDNAS